MFAGIEIQPPWKFGSLSTEDTWQKNKVSTMFIKSTRARWGTILAGGLLFSAASTANASLIGTTVDCDIQPPQALSCSTASAQVSANSSEFIITFVQTVPVFDIDIDDRSIKLTSLSSIGIGFGFGAVLTLSNLFWANFPMADIQGVEEFSAMSPSRFDITDVSTAAHSVTLLLDGSDWNPGDMATITLDVSHVPEPATLTLFGFGLAGLGVMRRRRKAAA